MLTVILEEKAGNNKGDLYGMPYRNKRENFMQSNINSHIWFRFKEGC